VQGLCGFIEVVLAVDRSDARLGSEFAVDVLGRDQSLQRVEVGEFEFADAWVVGGFEEEGLAVAAVLGLYQDHASDDDENQRGIYPSCGTPACLSSLEHNDMQTFTLAIFEEVMCDAGTRDARPDDHDVCSRRQVASGAVGGEQGRRLAVPEGLC